MAEHRHRRRRQDLPLDQRRAFLRHAFRVERLQTDELLAIGPPQFRQLERAFADEIGLVAGNQLSEAEVHRRYRAVGVLPHGDETGLRPEKVHRLGAEGRDRAIPPRLHDRLPDCEAIGCRNVDLKTQAAGVADAEHPRRNPGDTAAAHGHGRQGIGGHVDPLTQPGEDPSAVRSDQRDHGPLLRHRRKKHAKIGPFGLEPFLKPGVNAGSTAGRGRHVEMPVGQPRGDAVVHHHAVIAEHQPVAAPADGQRVPPVCVDAVEEFGGVGTLDVDLAEG